MNTNSREVDFTTKQAEGNTSEIEKISKASSSSSSTPWSKLRDPRIVRVSRAFGGKDRHSKVCTIRGLRDRRVRLSVPTAIQLYDLQDRLGLNQPSKVVDWLLNAAKHEIDELPPLQIPPGNFVHNHQLTLANSQSNKEGFNLNSNINWDIDHHPLGLSRSSFWSSDANVSEKSKEVVTERENERDNWKKGEENEEEKQGGLEGTHGTYGSTNFLPRPNNQSSTQGLINNFMPYNSFYRLDPSNFSFSHLGGNGGINAPQTEDLNTCNVVPLSLPSGSQVLICPPTAQPYFPSHGTNSMEFDPKQTNHFQMFSSSSLNPLSSPPLIRPFNLSMASKFFPSDQNNSDQSQPDKDEDFPPK